MSQERTEAVVLRGVDFSGSSRIVTFLTPDRGRMACMAQGVRRAKSRYGGMLDTFNRLELVYYWKEGRGVQKLGDVSLLDAFAAIKADLDKAMYAAFPLELAYKVAQENEPSRELYAALVNGFTHLAAWEGDVRTHVDWQVLQLLAAAGFELPLDLDAAGRDRVGFSFESGVVMGPERPDRQVAARDYATLCALGQSRNACPDVKDSGAVFALLRGYAGRQLETDFRSVRVIEQMADVENT